jgi:DNA-binding CsgD family transcriptional regulator
MDTTSERTALRDLLVTDYRWTPRQRQVLDLIARGKSNQEVADALGISLDGAKWHMREILSKLGMDTREEAADYWRHRNGLRPRFARLLRGTIGAGAGKWVTTGVVATAAGGMAAGTVLAAYAAFGGLSEGRGESGKPSQLEASVAIGLPASTDLSAVLAGLSASHSEALAAIAAVEAEDVEALLTTLAFVDLPCTPAASRGAVTPRCDALGVPEGTTVPMFHYWLRENSYRTERQMDELLRDFLIGHKPKLGLIAKKADGSYIFSFTLGERAETDPMGIDFFIERDRTSFSSYTERFGASTVLIHLRDRAAGAGESFEVLYVSDAMLEWDRAAQDAQRNPMPAATP